MNRRNFVKTATIGAAASTLVLPTLSSADEEKSRLRMQILWGKEAKDMFDNYADNVKIASNKSLRIQMFQSGSIVPDEEMLSAVSSGTIDMCQGFGGYWPGKIDIGVIESGIAAAWTNYDEAYYLFNNGLNALIKEAYAEQNVNYLGTMFGGHYDLVSKVPVKSIEDLKKLKIRATPSVAKILQQFDIPTVFMPSSELYVGLSTGAIDGCIYGGPIEYVGMKLYEVAKNYTKLGLINPGFTECILVNQDTWNGLTPENQKVLEMATNQHTAKMHGWLVEGMYSPKYSKYFDFHTLPDEDVKQLRKAATVLWEEEAAKSERNKKAIELITKLADNR